MPVLVLVEVLVLVVPELVTVEVTVLVVPERVLVVPGRVVVDVPVLVDVVGTPVVDVEVDFLVLERVVVVVTV